MIKIDKGYRHDYLASDDVTLALEKLNEFYSSKDRSQKRYGFPFIKKIDKNLKPILYDLFHGKCGYCETKIDSYNSGVIDRFRPHNGVRNKKEYFEDLYWWLTYSWKNLIYSCQECSRYKANYFPISGERVTSKNTFFEQEKRLLLNPCLDKVEEFLIHKHGHLSSNTDEGVQTIELLKLNRKSLTNNRALAISEIDVLVDKITEDKSKISPLSIDYLNKIYDNDSEVEFLLVKYQHLVRKIIETPEIGDFLDGFVKSKASKDKTVKGKTSIAIKSQIEPIISDFFPIESIEIENFKSISSIKFEFPNNEQDQNSWITILGENGLGKSSILQAICLGLHPLLNNGDDIISKLIQDGKDESKIIIKQKDSDNILITNLYRDGNIITHEGDFFSSLIGYGSVRLLPNEILIPEPIKNKTKYHNIFDPTIPLDDIFSWLSSIYTNDKAQFNSIAYSLKQLLPEEIEENLIIENGKLLFEESRITFQSLSDGYKNTISLALDIMKTLSEERADMDKLSGIVLIDELGNQLHPRWQMQVVGQFRKVFPKINFIVSTHHPLCLRSLKKGEVMVLNKNEEGNIFIVENLPDSSVLRVDQLLTSPYFGLHSAIDPKIEKMFNDYYALLAKDKLTDSEENQKLLLSDKIPRLKFLGDSLREELAIYVIDELLAKKARQTSELTNLDDLKKEAKDRVKSIWENLNKSEEE